MELIVGVEVICPDCLSEYTITEDDVEDDGFLCPECDNWIDKDDLDYEEDA